MKNKPSTRSAKKLDLAIDAMLHKSGISRVTNKPSLDEFINKKFVRDITAIILDAPDEIEGDAK